MRTHIAEVGPWFDKTLTSAVSGLLLKPRAAGYIASHKNKDGVGKPMANAWAGDRAGSFYLLIGVLGLAVVSFGFGVTYAAPMLRRTFSAPWFVHLHGASALGWVLLLIAQTSLVRRGKPSVHQWLGRVAIPLATIIWVTGIVTAFWAAQRDLASLGTVATSTLAGTATGLGLCLLLVIAAIVTRSRPDWHKRLILLATIQLLWPAFFRLRHWFPAVPDPEIWFALVLAYSPIVVAAARDKLHWGSIHPVWRYVAPILVIEQCLEVAYFDQGAQRLLGEWLFALMS